MPKPIPALNHVKFCPHGPARYCTAAGENYDINILQYRKSAFWKPPTQDRDR